MDSGRAKSRARPAGRRGYLGRRPDPLTSLLLTVPLFLVYHLGILLVDLRNGADLVTGLMLRLLQHSAVTYGVTVLGLGLGIAVVARLLGTRGQGSWKAVWPLLGESACWAVVMLVTVGWATHQVIPNCLVVIEGLPVDTAVGSLGSLPAGFWQAGADGISVLQVGGGGMGPIDKIVMAAGAGYHEELVFRVALFGGGAWLLGLVMPRWLALALVAVGAALVFAAVHYLGPLGDTFTITSFIFRFFAGLFLTALYRRRGFAVAAYTHALYDVMVMFVFT